MLRPITRQLDELVLELGLAAPMWTDPDELLESGAMLAELPTLLLIGPNEIETGAGRLLLTSRTLPRPHIAVLPARLPSWERQDMTVREMYPASLRLSDLASVVMSS